MALIRIYTVFHLNMAFSSIEEEHRPEVICRCYWPVLNLVRSLSLPIGIEASGYTLESIAALDPAWVGELRRLITEGPCEFIGSGYAQIIGPLVPAEVNAVNLRLGNQAYERLLAFRPEIALVNEQAYSAGMVQHYLDAGYQAIVMEWNNPARYHPEWNMEWRYLPQLATGQHGEETLLIWNNAITFQKFQRYAHGEMELEEYLDYLVSHLAEKPRVFPLYGNDVEIFDFRPGRYETETNIQEDGEWVRIGRLFEALLRDDRLQLIRPRQVLDLMQVSGAGNRLHLESSEQPIPVKKQGKYNVTRWAVTGRDDLGINTACWRICEGLKANPSASDDEWRELCYLWSSDFRTHITEKRWGAYLERLTEFEEKVCSYKEAKGKAARDKPLPYDFLHQIGQPFAKKTRRVTPCGLPEAARDKPARFRVPEFGNSPERPSASAEALRCRAGLATRLPLQGTSGQVAGRPLPYGFLHQIGQPFAKKTRRVAPCGLSHITHNNIKDDGRYLSVETNTAKVRLNCRRGLAVDGLSFKDVSDKPLVGTMHHGYYDDISLGVDYYTGHLIFESPGQTKVTDLNPVEPKVENNKSCVNISGTISTPLGSVYESIRVFNDIPLMELNYRLDWEFFPLGSLRLGNITLNPAAFKRETLHYCTHNGGYSEETFALNKNDVDHGDACSFLVSTTQGIGITEGAIELGDAQHCLRVEVDKSNAALIGLITYRQVNNTYFFRLALSALEMDETSRLNGGEVQGFPQSIRLSLTPVYQR